MQQIKDFKVGQNYLATNGVVCKVINVTNSNVTLKMRNVELTLKKVLYAGVYACLKQGLIFALSDKIQPIDDSDIVHKLNGPHKKRNIYFKINTHGETYYDIFKETR